MKWDEAEQKAGPKRNAVEIHDRDVRNLEEVTRYDLREAEEDAFGDMLRELHERASRTLTMKQREWVQGVAERVGAKFEDDDIVDQMYENLVSSGKVKANPNAPKFPFETMARPLKPPGRK